MERKRTSFLGGVGVVFVGIVDAIIPAGVVDLIDVSWVAPSVGMAPHVIVSLSRVRSVLGVAP
jgi:hypothetical protein